VSVFILRRLLTLLATLAGASVIIFLVLDALPGNAAEMLMGADSSPEALRAMTDQARARPAAGRRYLHWIGGLLVGDLGNSYSYGTPVAELIAERLALTIPLAVMAMLLTVVLALAAGVYTAANHNKVGDVGVMAVTQFGIAIPNFWFAILLILLFSVKLQWLSAGGFAGWGEGIVAGHPVAAAAGDFARGGAGCDPGAGHAFGGARSAARGFRAHGARQGPHPGGRCCGGTCCATP
jgi:ABC-type dipeptide/oligopeptide/nickel transport systems, permease components